MTHDALCIREKFIHGFICGVGLDQHQQLFCSVKIFVHISSLNVKCMPLPEHHIGSTLRHCETPLRRVWSSCPSRSWPPRSWTTAVDGSEILYQWRLVVYPSIHKALSISNGAGFLPSTVWKTWNSNRFTTCSNNNQLWLIARFYPMLPNFALDVMQKKNGCKPFLYRAMVTVRPHQILEISLLPLLWALHKYLHGVQSMSGKCLDATLSI